MIDDVTFGKIFDEPNSLKRREWGVGAFWIDCYDDEEYLNKETNSEQKALTNKKHLKQKTKNKKRSNMIRK